MTSYLDRIKERFQMDFGVEVDPGELDDSVLQDMLDKLLPHVAGRLRTRPHDLNAKLEIHISEEQIINGCTYPEDDGEGFTIEIAWGLLIFFHKIIKLFVSRMSVRDDDEIIEETRISEEHMLETSRRLLNGFFDGTIFNLPSIPLSNLTKSQILLSGYLLYFAELFVVGHELGHIIINTDLEKAKREILIASASTEERNRTFLDDIGIEETKKEIAMRRWPRELAADMIGLQLCMQLYDDFIGRMVIRASAGLIFITMILLENFHKKSKGSDYWIDIYRYHNMPNHNEMNHPPTCLRLEFLQAYIDQDYPQLTADELGKTFEEWGQYILSKV